MKKSIHSGLCMISLLLLSGCSVINPILFGPVSQTTTSNVDQAKDEGYIRFTNIGSQHQIFLDGTIIGTGEAYSSGGQLGVTPGSHEIEIREAGFVRLKQKVFIATGSTRTIEVP